MPPIVHSSWRSIQALTAAKRPRANPLSRAPQPQDLPDVEIMDRSDLAPRSNWLNGWVAVRAGEVRGRIRGRRVDARVAVFATAMAPLRILRPWFITENCLTSDLESAA